MCDQCGYQVCPPSCPGYENDGGICDICGQPIKAGDWLIERGKREIHSRCLIDMMSYAPSAVLDLLGVDVVQV